MQQPAVADSTTLPDPDELRDSFRRALEHQRNVREQYSLRLIAKEIGSVQQPALSKFLAHDTTPKPDTVRAIQKWINKHPPPPLTAKADPEKPSDYGINLRRLLGLHMNGVPFARYTDLSKTLGLGQLHDNANTIVKQALLPALRRLDLRDTKWTVACVKKSGDFDVEFDGFHSSNRDAVKGFGTFHSSEVGFCLKIVTTSKKDAGVNGVAQRHEKVGFKRGLEEMILVDGLAPDLIGTDQCKGAPADILKVVAKPEVQQKLHQL